jgi:hypothetical protein
MKVGDLIQWIEHKEIQYVPVKQKRLGVISALGFRESRSKINKVYVITTNGDRAVIDSNQWNYQTIEVINENR